MNNFCAPTIHELKVRNAHEKNFYKNLPEDFKNIFLRVKDTTMLSRERLFDFYNSIQYVVKNQIPGDIVEIGCWAGGSIAMARATLDGFASNHDIRSVYGFDTYEGHGRPPDHEYDVWGNKCALTFNELDEVGESWAKVDLEQVQKNLTSINGSLDGFTLIKGRVEDVAKHSSIKKIAILRIDVDWYEPTLFSLEYFYPMIPRGGVIIIDDYGHHSGSRDAVNHFFKDKLPKFFYTDYSCISAIKLE
jgi:hypothetical protein